MPTLYYTDGTFLKYNSLDDYKIFRDPYLKLDSRFFIKKPYKQSNNYCCSEFEKISETINCSFDECVEKGNVLEKVKIENIKNRIIETNSININGLLEHVYDDHNCNIYPMIDKKIISELENMFPNVTKIKLSNNRLNENDINFKKFKKCEVLYLKNNYFFTITLDICNLKNLRILKISRWSKDKYKDKIFTIPNYISKLKNLEILDLSNNNINIVPSEICELIKLKKLILSWNNFNEIPKEIGNLINLQILDLSKNYRSESAFLELPKEIGNLYNLKELLLQGVSCIIPKEIGKLNNLIKLIANGVRSFDHNSNPSDFGGTDFDKLPLELWNCEKLNELQINNFIGGEVDNFNNPTLSCQVLFKSKKNIIIFNNYGYYGNIFKIIHNKENNYIIIKRMLEDNIPSGPNGTHIFTFKDDKNIELIIE
jgi:Leucine-rich repeat (LRR) protein